MFFFFAYDVLNFLRFYDAEMSITFSILQAEAIRKILGQDSNRKKREEKIKKQQEELAQVSHVLLGFQFVIGYEADNQLIVVCGTGEGC